MARWTARFIRKTAKTRSWEKAEELKRSWEEAESPKKIEPVTIDAAVEAWRRSHCLAASFL